MLMPARGTSYREQWRTVMRCAMSIATGAVCFSKRPLRVIRQSSTRQSAGKLSVSGPGVRSSAAYSNRSE